MILFRVSETADDTISRAHQDKAIDADRNTTPGKLGVSVSKIHNQESNTNY